MKLSQLDLNPTAKIRESTNFAVREIRKVCKNIGGRAPGTPNEDKAQDYVIETCSKFAHDVQKETFKLSPRAFLAWPWVAAIMMLISIALFELSSFDVVPQLSTPFNIASLAIVVLCILMIVFDFLLYKPVLDPFFKKSTSSNVLLTRKPTGEVKRRIVIGGHIDSSYEWRFTHLGGSRLLKTAIISAISAIVVCLVVDVANLIFEPGDTLIIVFRCAQGVAAFICLVGFAFENGKVVVDGANDNLTGVFAAMAVLQFLATNNIELENTEVVAASMGAEESGLRGSKALVKAHAKQYNEVETAFIACDTLRDFDDMGILVRDMTGTVKLDSQVAALMKKASTLAGLDLPYASCFFGSSDAAAMAQGGVKSVLLAAMDPAPARYYHTRLDKADNLEQRTIEKGIETLVNAVLLFDEQGLKNEYE